MSPGPGGFTRYLLSTIALLLSLPSVTPAQPPAALVVAIDEATFAPLDPNRPDGAQMAVLRGDPTKGPSDVLVPTPPVAR